MATPVEVPKLGNTVEECLVAKWRKQKGDSVEAGDVVAEIETDKATFEITAPVGGTLLETFFDEGTLVPVFTNLFVIGEPGENADDFRPPSAHAVKTGSETAAPANPEATSPEPEPDAPSAGLAPMSPRARRFARQHDVRIPVAGSGPGGRILEQDLRRAWEPPQGTAAGSRPANTSAGRWPAAGQRASAGLAPAVRISGIREKIARRMRESLSATAQYTLTASANAAALLSLRGRIKASPAGADVNINHLVTFCAVKALLDVPALNAEFIDGGIHQHAEVHIAFACDTERGLLAPVVRDAHRLAIRELAAAMKELAAQAVQGTISAGSLTGATFTISNLGGLGIESFTPLLNPPQVAILGVGAIQVKPVRRGGNIEFIDAIGLSLTCDHQVIDGAPGARFLQVLREKIENAESLMTI